MVALILLMLIIIILAAVFSWLAVYVAWPKKHTLESSWEAESKIPFLQGVDVTPEKEYKVRSYDGYELCAAYLPAKAGDAVSRTQAGSERFVILSHGYTYTRNGALKYVYLFRKLGYNCIIYDNRGHGANPNTKVMFGLREAKDLLAVIEDTYERYGQNISIGLHGESMGGGLQITALKYRPRVDFVINDCGYADLTSVLKWKAHYDFHMPGWVVLPSSLCCKLIFGYFFGEVRPIDSLPDNQVPICFIHGEEDMFVKKEHSERMHKATKGYSELHLFPGADHAQAITSDVERYEAVLKAFLDKVYSEKDV